MNVDVYTKAVLTIIAGSLLWLCAQNALHLSVVSAQTPGPQRVVIVGGQTIIPMPVRIIGGTKYKDLEISEGNPLAVAIDKPQ